MPENNPGDNPGELRDGPNGGKLRTGGVNPRAGRPPNEFKERMRTLVSREDVESYFERCLMGEFGPKFHIAALREASDRGYGKAAQPIVGEDGGALKANVTLRLVKASKVDGDD